MRYYSRCLCLGTALFLSFADYLVPPSFAQGESRILTTEGSYTMGDGETPIVAEFRALQQAKRMAVEQAGTYFESYSKTKNLDLTVDELQTLASALVEVDVLEKKRTVVGEGILFYIKIKATVTTDKADELVLRLKAKNQQPGLDIVTQYKELQAHYDRLAKEMEALKQQINAAKTDEGKGHVADEIAKQERRYLATVLSEEGFHQKDPVAVIEYYTKAIKLDPSFLSAYFRRGGEYLLADQHENAIADFTNVLRLNPTHNLKAPSYVGRAAASMQLKRYDPAIADFTEAIALYPESESKALLFMARGKAFYYVKKYDQATPDFSEAIRLGRKVQTIRESHGYRGASYMFLNQPEKAVSDIVIGCDLGDALACGLQRKLAE